MSTIVFAPHQHAETRHAYLAPGMALFLGAWLAGLLQFLFVGGYGFGRGYEMAAIARSLAEHGAYANPFAPAITGPTALVPPLHPLFLAALLRLFHSDAGMRIAAIFANILANAAIAALLPKLAAACDLDGRIGVIAGALWIASMRLLPQWDVSNSILGLMCFCLLTSRNIRRGESGAWALAAGAIGGALLLLNPSTVFVMGPWLMWQFVHQRAGWRSAVRYTALAGAVAALCVAPWIARNYRIWGTPVLRTSLGITLYSSNSDCAQPSLYQEALTGCIQKTFPVDSEPEARLLRTLGEVRYDRLRTADTLRWISAHPARFLQLTAGRIRDFWFPAPMESAYTCYAIWGITLLSIPGIVLMARRRRAVVPLLLCCWLIYPLLYYVVVSCDRYRYPILWMSLLPAGYAIEALVISGFRRASRPALRQPC